MRRLHGGGEGGPSKNDDVGILFMSKSSFCILFWFILLYFRASGVLPIDPVRRELQNAIGEVGIGDFVFFFDF